MKNELPYKRLRGRLVEGWIVFIFLRNFLGGTDFVQFCADSEIFVPARECANKRPVALASPMACGSRVPPPRLLQTVSLLAS